MKQASYKQVERSLQELAQEEIEPFHYERTMTHVREKIERRNTIMFAFKNVAIGSGVVVALIIAMVLIPATYSVNVGSIVKAQFAMNDETVLMPIMEATQSIPDVVNRQLQVNNGIAELTLAFQDRSADEVEGELRDALVALVNDPEELVISSENITKYMGGNALAAVTGGRVLIGCDQMSEDEIKERIMSELTARGVNVRDVSISKKIDGDRIQMEIRVEAEPGEDGELPQLPEDLLPEIDADSQERVIIRRQETQ
ncbi:MAG: hypothetical protein P9M15_07735 [Candidatus Electryoneaceae bacterium]|nr:hypothetical protein [Candidatus Electryoneaceae bacterium]